MFLASLTRSFAKETVARNAIFHYNRDIGLQRPSKKGLLVMKPEETIELIVPAARDVLLVLRLTTAGVISRVGMDMDAMDDMKMAVEESFNCLMMQRPGFERLIVRYHYHQGQVDIQLQGIDPLPGEGVVPNESELQVIRCILESMADSVTLKTHGEGIEAVYLTRAATREGPRV